MHKKSTYGLSIALGALVAIPALATPYEEAKLTTGSFATAPNAVYCNSTVPSTAGSGDRRYYLWNQDGMGDGPARVGIDYNLSVSSPTLFYSYFDSSFNEQGALVAYLSSLTTGGAGTALNYELIKDGSTNQKAICNSYSTQISSPSFTPRYQAMPNAGVGVLGYYCASTSVSQVFSNCIWQNSSLNWAYWPSSTGSVSTGGQSCSVAPHYSGSVYNNGTAYAGIY